MIRIGVVGACGRMGQRIIDLVFKAEDMELAAAVERGDSPSLGSDIGDMIGRGKVNVEVTSDLAQACDSIDCLIDFTLPGPTLGNVAICSQKNIPMVIGTTGLDEAGENAISDAAHRIPIVFSPNMSIGVNLLFNLVRDAARVLGDSSEIRIDETHHVHKKDSPSGTAKMIARVVKETCDKTASIEAFREGEVVGDHGISFDTEFETVEIRHNAKKRDVFAAGAIKAARFVCDKSPGLYDMKAVLGLK